MNRSKGATACIAIGTIFVILGLLISFFSLALTPAAAPVPYTSDTRISDETYGTVYDFGQVLVIDQYGYIEYDGFSDEHYYIIGISLDSSDTVYLASLRVDEDTAIFDKLKDYAYDENAYVGDMYLKLCATAEPINDIDPDMKRYYYESLDTYKSYFTDTTDLEIGLTFYCEGTAAYSSTAIAGSAAYIVVAFAGIAMSAAGIICLIIGIVKKVRAKTPQYVMPGNGYYYNPQQNQWNNGMPVNNPQNQWNNGAPINNPQNQWNNSAPNNYTHSEMPSQRSEYQQNTQIPNNNKGTYFTPPGEKYSNDYNNGSQNPPDGGNENQNG